MPRNMSFALTTEQIRNRTKTVTRRLGWWNLKAGDLFWAVEKVRGLKKGEKLKRLSLLRCVSNRAMKLDSIKRPDLAREGFPDMRPSEFVAMFCKHMSVVPWAKVQRIEFEYVEEGK